MWSTHVKNHSTLGRPLASLIFSDQTVLIPEKNMPFVLNPTWNFFNFRSGPTCTESEFPE